MLRILFSDKCRLREQFPEPIPEIFLVHSVVAGDKVGAPFLFLNLVFFHVAPCHLPACFAHSLFDLIHQCLIRKHFFQSAHNFASTI